MFTPVLAAASCKDVGNIELEHTEHTAVTSLNVISLTGYPSSHVIIPLAEASFCVWMMKQTSPTIVAVGHSALIYTENSTVRLNSLSNL